MAQKSNRNSFIIQGSILAFAGILVRIIGLIYRIPLTRILGKVGNDYYTTAYDIYNVLILLSSQSMPLAVSKIVSEKLEKKEYKNSHKVFKGALFYGLFLGVIFGLFAFLGADWIATTFYDTPPAARALKVLAPTITIVCVLGVVRGYFQGMGNMIPTAISQVFEQIVNAIVSVLAAYELGVYGLSLAKMSNLSADASSTLKLSWSAAGGTLGTFMGAVIALLIMITILFRKSGDIKTQMTLDVSGKTDSYSTITKVIVFTITPVLISTTIYNISNLLDNPIYKNISGSVFHVADSVKSAAWGLYSGQYRLLTTMPIAIAAALSTAIVPSLVRSYTAKDSAQVKNKISLALKFAMIIAFPCGMGLSVLGGPINNFLWADGSRDTAMMMIFSIFTVIAFSLSTISNAILQGIDKLKVPIKNSAISLVLHLMILPVLMLVFKLGIYAVVIGDITFGATVSVLNAYSIKKYLDYKQDLKETFLKPLICSAFMGVGCILVYYGMIRLIPYNAICTLSAIIAAVIIYGIVLIVTKTITEEELYSMPKGGVIVRIFKKIRLL
ncbi:MAG: polysaccharide biosynthesis C-terminal domain-containing protein [Eubacterium sp.]